MKRNNPRKQSTELEQIVAYLLQQGESELIDRIHTYSVGLFVKYYGLEPKNVFKTKKNSNHAGVQRNDLPGHFKVIGNKIYIRYRGKDIATKCSNTAQGWKNANKFWDEKHLEFDAIISGKKQADDVISNIYSKFIDYKKQYDKITENTIKEYNSRIKQVFTDFSVVLNEKNINNSLEKFIKNTSLNPISVNHYLSVVQIFFNWCSDDDRQYIPKKDYTTKYKQKASTNIRAPYTEEEYKMFVDYFEKNNKEMSLFIQFLWHTGARGSETINIKISDIDFKNNYILVPNKIYKSQQESILLTDETKEIVRKTISLKKSKTDKLFSWKNISTPFKLLRKLEKQLNMQIKGRGLHGFRRSFADKLFRKEFAIDRVQEIMRHRTINTTLKSYKSMNKENIVSEMNDKLK